MACCSIWSVALLCNYLIYTANNFVFLRSLVVVLTALVGTFKKKILINSDDSESFPFLSTVLHSQCKCFWSKSLYHFVTDIDVEDWTYHFH